MHSIEIHYWHFKGKGKSFGKVSATDTPVNKDKEHKIWKLSSCIDTVKCPEQKKNGKPSLNKSKPCGPQWVKPLAKWETGYEADTNPCYKKELQIQLH